MGTFCVGNFPNNAPPRRIITASAFFLVACDILTPEKSQQLKYNQYFNSIAALFAENPPFMTIWGYFMK
jgi:hypothetical protein